MSDLYQCNMCGRKDDVCTNLQHNHATVLTVSDITRLPSWHIRQILSSMCSRCLVYISAITESSSKLRMACEQAIQSQGVVLAPPTPDTSPNNFLQVSALLDDTTGQPNNEQQQRRCYGPGYCDDTANDLPLPLVTSSPPLPPAHPSSSSPQPPTFTMQQEYEATSRSPSPNNPGQNSMLRIHYERSVSPLNTESGGGGVNRKRSYQRIQVIPVQMICPHCHRAYWRKDYYRKHMRRCSAKFRYAKSLAPQRSHSISHLELDTISLPSERNESATTHYKPRTFRCNVCTVTVDSIAKLRQHKRIHMPYYYCDICSNECTTQNEYDFHRVQCLAKVEALKVVDKNDVSATTNMTTRRSTRAYSRAISVAPSRAAPSIASTNKTKITAKKIKMPNKNVTVAKSTTSISGLSKITNYKAVNSVASQASVLNAADETDEDDDDDDDDDDAGGNISEDDTLYSKRISLTNHWVEEHSSSHSYLSSCSTDSMDEDIQFPSLKEYDLYLLDRLKNEVNARYITCFMPGCRFVSATLNDMMVHDYMYHYKKPWFYCRKCGFCFTSKVFLDYHLDLQDKAGYRCYKCGFYFDYQHQLDRHLIQHERLVSTGGEKYICQFCDLKFLDEDNLLTHCSYENHDWNKKRNTIEIDHSMTISNKVPQKSSNTCNKNKTYQVKILNMLLKIMPSKRCTPMEKYRQHLAPHLRIRNRIGQVEFPDPSEPNCVGCL